jgi:hypothetical protein
MKCKIGFHTSHGGHVHTSFKLVRIEMFHIIIGTQIMVWVCQPVLTEVQEAKNNLNANISSFGASQSHYLKTKYTFENRWIDIETRYIHGKYTQDFVTINKSLEYSRTLKLLQRWEAMLCMSLPVQLDRLVPELPILQFNLTFLLKLVGGLYLYQIQ